MKTALFEVFASRVLSYFSQDLSERWLIESTSSYVFTYVRKKLLLVIAYIKNASDNATD
ncbi:hypothetical protein X777_12830 [Ooceraea biroi]|uniref:Uncharacterized protein n=1 Tax=Ooceraea biroi TaxID=2015173 RepID=A0A026VZZ1_OOCBI|nr:hypothetical protein X777_12830 [Ooceraea biroi]